jgi:3-phenylpropionate/trans-cinnamate dioxygenase ferredoxin reductase subunit
MLGETEPYRELPYFFSDLADWASLEYVGPADDWDEIVWRGDRDAAEFSAWYLKDDRVVAALSVGRSDDLVHARRLIESRTDLSRDSAALADSATELDSLGI